MIGFVVAMLLLVAPQQSGATQVSVAQKQEFLRVLKTLPHKSEFFTDEAIKAAGPYLPVLFALTDKDIEGYDIYPFAALSRGLCDVKEHRNYATTHFGDIQNSQLKLFWAAMLFDENPSREVVLFLKGALKSEAQAKLLAEITGPNFAAFKGRVEAAPKN